MWIWSKIRCASYNAALLMLFVLPSLSSGIVCVRVCACLVFEAGRSLMWVVCFLSSMSPKTFASFLFAYKVYKKVS